MEHGSEWTPKDRKTETEADCCYKERRLTEGCHVGQGLGRGEGRRAEGRPAGQAREALSGRQ